MNDAFFPARRSFLARMVSCGLAAASLILAPGVQAQGRGRMPPDEREQLRRALRERGGAQWANGPERGNAARGYNPGQGRQGAAPSRDFGGRRLSDDERQQLRRQLREQGRRRD
jgi:hypothetical protein